jgi:hypothetical protein
VSEIENEINSVVGILESQKKRIIEFIEEFKQEKYLKQFKNIVNNPKNRGKLNIIKGDIKEKLQRIKEVDYNSRINDFKKTMDKYFM